MTVETRPKNAKVWKRDPLDFYTENIWCTTALLRAELPPDGIWDPCCGSGNIVKAALAADYDAIGTDIVRRVDHPNLHGDLDFFERTWPLGESIISNPPFFRAKGTERFIRHALSLNPEFLAVFAPLPFLAGQKRAAGLFAEHRPDRAWIISPRPSCPPGEMLLAGEVEANGGTEDWLWLVWTPRQTSPFRTAVDWLMCDQTEAV